jgi:hypothetical protein
MRSYCIGKYLYAKFKDTASDQYHEVVGPFMDSNVVSDASIASYYVSIVDINTYGVMLFPNGVNTEYYTEYGTRIFPINDYTSSMIEAKGISTRRGVGAAYAMNVPANLKIKVFDRDNFSGNSKLFTGPFFGGLDDWSERIKSM